jgi:hypothetical protein
MARGREWFGGRLYTLVRRSPIALDELQRLLAGGAQIVEVLPQEESADRIAAGRVFQHAEPDVSCARKVHTVVVPISRGPSGSILWHASV